MAVAIRTATRIQDQDDAPALGAGQNGYALTWDNATGAFVAGERDIVLRALNNVRSVVEFTTPGALVEAPWVLGTITVDPLAHDNVLYAGYNARRNNATGVWERQQANEHCIVLAVESRFHTTDPENNRGKLEWYMRIDPALTGTPNFTAQPFAMTYNYDTPGSAWWFGEAANAAASTVNLYGATLIQGNSVMLKNAAGTKSIWSVDQNGAATFGDPADAGTNEFIYNGSLNVHNARLLRLRGGTNQRYRMTLNMSDNGGGTLSVYDEGATVHLPFSLTYGEYAIFNANISYGRHQFDINGTRRVVINSTGIGINTTFPASAIDLDAGAMTMKEMSAPGAPAANSAVIYVVDNGSDKTQLMVRFASGAAQQIAIEP